MTDSSVVYRSHVIRSPFAKHDMTNHRAGEYARPGGIHSNTVESAFALLKRGIYGTFHNVSRKHLHRYVAEFDFRWNARKIDDGERTALAIRSAEGKRLRYRDPVATLPPTPDTGDTILRKGTSMTDTDRRRIENLYVAQVLILAKQIDIEDRKKGYNSQSSIKRAMKLISEERTRILAGRP